MQKKIESVLKEFDFRANPYFEALKNDEFEFDDFVETQIQFFFAVLFFNRPMSVLAAKIPTSELRREVLRNVWEEHGDGKMEETHANTFLTLLNRLDGISPQDVEARALWPEVRAFNTALSGVCTLDEYQVAVGVMGMIERMFCEISAFLGQEITRQGWLAEKDLIHYGLHAELDIKHSQDFFDIVKPAWDQSEANQYYISQGLELGACIFDSMYRGLHRSRKRRVTRSVTGPHTRA